MRATSESAEWIFLATNLGLEILSAACDQASSPRRPHFARFGMLLAIAAVFISIGQLIYRGKRESVVLRRWGMLWWFYHPSPRHTPFGTLPDIYGLVAGISQCICSIVQYVYCLRHADNPFKASLLPAIFLICLVGSRLSNNRMNANTSSTEVTSLHPIPDNQEVEVEGNKEQQKQELLQEQEQEQEREWERLLQEQERLLREQEWEQELERERLLQEQEQEWERGEQERERLLQLPQWEREQERERERLLQEQERERERLLQEQERERERERLLQEQERERERLLRERLLQEQEQLLPEWKRERLLQEQLETKLK